MKLTEVPVLNHETKMVQYLTLREDRLVDFYKFMSFLRRTGIIPATNLTASFWSGDTGAVSAVACTGLSAIFTYIPAKFPIVDALQYLCNGGDYSIQDVEEGVARFGQTVPLLQGDGQEIL